MFVRRYLASDWIFKALSSSLTVLEQFEYERSDFSEVCNQCRVERSRKQQLAHSILAAIQLQIIPGTNRFVVRWYSSHSFPNSFFNIASSFGIRFDKDQTIARTINKTGAQFMSRERATQEGTQHPRGPSNLQKKGMNAIVARNAPVYDGCCMWL